MMTIIGKVRWCNRCGAICVNETWKQPDVTGDDTALTEINMEKCTDHDYRPNKLLAIKADIDSKRENTETSNLSDTQPEE